MSEQPSPSPSPEDDYRYRELESRRLWFLSALAAVNPEAVDQQWVEEYRTIVNEIEKEMSTL